MARKAKRERYPRRKRGTGTIRHKAARPLPWEAEWRHADGTPEYRGFQERVQAEEWLDSLIIKRQKNQDTAAGAMTFEIFIKKWLAIKFSKSIAPKTKLCYRYYAEIAAGEIGDVRIDCLTLEHMERLAAYLTKAQFHNIKAVFAMLGQAFKYARSPSLRWMIDDPIDGLEIPTIRRKKRDVLNERQRQLMLEMAAQNDDLRVPLLPLWHLYSRFGLRKGEGIALEWRDVDWENQTLTIDESISNVGPDNLRGETKTRQVRVIPLPGDMIELLKEHRAAQQKRGIYRAIFTGKDGQVVTPQHVQYRWSILRKAAGCPGVTLHGLRHTALTLLALQGVPENIRMALAGHTSKDMAMLYTNHATVEDVRRYVG